MKKKFVKNGKDLCVLCKEETRYNTNTSIDLRYDYIEGVGQLCTNCSDKFNN